MRTLTIGIALIFSIASLAQTPGQTQEVTDSGVMIMDSTGRVVRFEGTDSVVVEYLYASADAQETSGVTVRVNEKLSLSVKYSGRQEVQAAGLPKLTSVFDRKDRTCEVLADDTVLARLEYTSDELFSRIVLPRYLTWTCTTEAPRRVRESVQDSRGKVVASVVGRAGDGIRMGWPSAAVAEDFGVDPDALTYEQSPTGALTTARDAAGRVAFYIVSIEGCDVGFAPNGEGRFYDLELRVLGGESFPGGDIVVSKAWEMQRATIPDHLVVTARGRAGVYLYEAAKDGIASAWTDAKSRVHLMKFQE
ncbi:MAG: hypothetical protein DMF56_23880 [Acidobacteria bacterium]|nr:MAG: hypothetical protein DMF56_23880 [Acidobacteriota bacterium]